MMNKYIKMEMVMIVGIMVSMLFMTSTAQEGPSNANGSPAEAPGPASQVKFQEEPCWQMISDCIGDKVNQSQSDPQFDPSSPSFNGTELLCCPLIQETVRTETQCFCTINTFIQQNSTQAQNMTLLLSVCGIADSDALNAFCQADGEAPSPTPAQVMQLPPTQDLVESSTSKVSDEVGGANKIKIATVSLSGLLVLLVSILFH